MQKENHGKDEAFDFVSFFIAGTKKIERTEKVFPS